MRDPAPAFPPLIPRPLAVAPERGAFELGPRARIVAAEAEAADVGRLLAKMLRPPTGYALPVVATPKAAVAGAVVLTLVPGDRALGDEGYRLRVGDRVTISARRPAGLFRGAQTFRQLMPASVESRSRAAGPWLVPRGTIHDRPRFAWRGLKHVQAHRSGGGGVIDRIRRGDRKSGV